LGDWTASISHIRIGKHAFDVSVGPGLQVNRDGQKLLESDHPIVLRNVVWEKVRVRFNVTVKSKSQLILYGFRENEEIRCISPTKEGLVARHGRVSITVDPEIKTVELLRYP
jgi:hypothetical protein